MGLMSWIVVLLVMFVTIYLILFSVRVDKVERTINDLLNILIKERKTEKFNTKQLIEDTIDFRLSFDKEQTRISETYNVSSNHAGCFISNGGVDEYVCKEYNGGCKDFDVCQRIRESEVK